MAPLVIKEWKASNQPIDSEGNFVRIVGRQGGVVAWFLALIKVDPITSLCLSQERVEISSASLSGTEHRMIPIGNVCSTYYGYHKPWKTALLLFLLFGFFLNIPGIISSASSGSNHMDVSSYLLGIVLAALIALVYYFLSRTLTLGFVEHSGVISVIHFKRSVIENVDVNESQARYICVVAQFLIEEARKPSQFRS